MKIKIKEARKEFEKEHGYKLTQERLAEAVLFDKGSSLKTKMDILNRMQRGEMSHPSLEIIERICVLCGVSLDWIIERK